MGSILALHSQYPLSMVSNKVSEASTKVWTSTWPYRASIMAPGGRDLGRFSSFWAGW